MTLKDLMIKISLIKDKKHITCYRMQQLSGIYHKEIRQILKGEKSIKMDTLILILKSLNYVLVAKNRNKAFYITSMNELHRFFDSFYGYIFYSQLDDFLSFAESNNVYITIKPFRKNNTSLNQPTQESQLTYCLFCGAKVPFKENAMREHTIQQHDVYVYDDPVFKNNSYRVFFSEDQPKRLCNSPKEQLFAPHKPKAISSLLFNKRGTKIQEEIVCSLCGTRYSYGFRYRTNVGEIKLCSYCKGKFKSSIEVQIIHKPGYTKEDNIILETSNDTHTEYLNLSQNDLRENKLKVTTKTNINSKNGSQTNAKNEMENITLEASPDFLPEGTYREGATMQVTINKYERNREARKKCIKNHGCYCNVCGFDFEKVYGNVGKQFIHVHHIVPLSEIGEDYKINPTEDLIPVCPNCHAMLHKKINGKVLSVRELQILFKNKK